MAITNKKINLWQLDNELHCKGLIADFNDDTKKVIKTADGSNITEEQLEEAISVHISIDDNAVALAAKAAAQAKLAALGLTTDDLKALGLGGN